MNNLQGALRLLMESPAIDPVEWLNDNRPIFATTTNDLIAVLDGDWKPFHIELLEQAMGHSDEVAVALSAWRANFGNPSRLSPGDVLARSWFVLSYVTLEWDAATKWITEHVADILSESWMDLRPTVSRLFCQQFIFGYAIAIDDNPTDVISLIRKRWKSGFDGRDVADDDNEVLVQVLAAACSEAAQVLASCNPSRIAVLARGVATDEDSRSLLGAIWEMARNQGVYDEALVKLVRSFGLPD